MGAMLPSSVVSINRKSKELSPKFTEVQHGLHLRYCTGGCGLVLNDVFYREER